MSITKAEKQDLIQKYQINDKDTGSVEVQVAILTSRINTLNECLRKNKKNFSLKSGLLKMVSQRRTFLKYLDKKDPKKSYEIKTKLGLSTK